MVSKLVESSQNIWSKQTYKAFMRGEDDLVKSVTHVVPLCDR